VRQLRHPVYVTQQFSDRKYPFLSRQDVESGTVMKHQHNIAGNDKGYLREWRRQGW
jgi:hypothetical protein